MNRIINRELHDPRVWVTEGENEVLNLNLPNFAKNRCSKAKDVKADKISDFKKLSESRRKLTKSQQEQLDFITEKQKNMQQ